jgi:hypothetical protein
VAWCQDNNEAHSHKDFEQFANVLVGGIMLNKN